MSTLHKLSSLYIHFLHEQNCSKSEVAGYVETYENLKKQRIRVYSILSFMPICPRDIFFFQIWLVIDNAQESDAGLNFTFKSSIPLDFFSSRAALNVIKLNLTAGEWRQHAKKTTA